MRALIATACLTFGIGMLAQKAIDRQTVVSAHENEMQANGLEDQCKATLTNTNQTMAAAFGATSGSTGIKFTPLHNGGWKYEHIPMPACKDGLKRTVDIPEQDEVDALTVNCGVEQ